MSLKRWMCVEPSSCLFLMLLYSEFVSEFDFDFGFEPESESRPIGS